MILLSLSLFLALLVSCGEDRQGLPRLESDISEQESNSSFDSEEPTSEETTAKKTIKEVVTKPQSTEANDEIEKPIEGPTEETKPGSETNALILEDEGIGEIIDWEDIQK